LPLNNNKINEINYTKQLVEEIEQGVNTMITTKALRLKPVRIIDILKGNILSPIVMADKILSKTIKVTVSNYLIYMPKVTRLFFKPLLLPFAEPY